jgi:hypothetical protein
VLPHGAQEALPQRVRVQVYLAPLLVEVFRVTEHAVGAKVEIKSTFKRSSSYFGFFNR